MNSICMKTISLISLGVMATLTGSLMSCSESLLEQGDSSGVSSDLICFAVSEGATTRALEAPVESLARVLPLVDGQANDSLYLTASEVARDRALTRAEMITDNPEKFLVTSMIRKQGETTENLYFRQQYQKSGTENLYQGAKNYYWPGSNWNLDFYAVNEEVTMNEDNVSFDYKVPEEQASQQDLLVAKAKNISGDAQTSVGLDFQHACTAIQFAVKNIPTTTTLKAIRLKGVRYKGTYHFNEETPWVLSDDTFDFECSGVEGTWMMLPQVFGEDDEAVVEVVLSESGKDDCVYTSKLAGNEWKEGQALRYTISINADYQINLDVKDQTVDAHYVKAKVVVNATYLDGKSWTLSADNDATLLFAAKANSFIQSGYWTDIDLSDGSSARGESSLTGTIDDSGKEIYVMIPQNEGTQTRQITLSLSVDGTSFSTSSIQQLAAEDGWEQIDEGDDGDFGFNWDRVAYYGYRYECAKLNVLTCAKYESYLNQIISENGATTYASVGYNEFTPDDKRLLQWRYYIKIDYAALNDDILNNSQSDGLSNTQELYEKAGTTVSNAFEETIMSIKKTEWGAENEDAFRYGDGTKTEEGYPDASSGTAINKSAAVGACLKKNRYNLQKSSMNDGIQSSEGYHLVLPEIVWYLPAVDEFKNIPSLQDPVVASECWSSSIGDNTTKAYSGSGAETERSTTLKIRAKRK